MGYASMDKLEVLMIENMRTFDWDLGFLHSLQEGLSKENFLYLYLTLEGRNLEFEQLALGTHWHDFRKKFKMAQIQDKRTYHWTKVVRHKPLIIAKRNEEDQKLNTTVD